MSRVYVFDTTLRDGEQSPGCSMTTLEKLTTATALVDLGVDILEAGFPIASEGDFEAVDAVSRQFPWVSVAALARASTLDVERAAKALQHAKRPRIHTFCARTSCSIRRSFLKSVMLRYLRLCKWMASFTRRRHVGILSTFCIGTTTV